MQIFFYLYDDKVLLSSNVCSLFLSNTDAEIWSKEKSVGPDVAIIFH